MKLKDLVATVKTNPLQKKILFISFFHKQELIEKELANTVFCSWDEVFIDNGNLMVGKDPISSFTFIFIGTTGKNEVKANLVRKYIELNKVPYLSYGCPRHVENKLLQSFLFTQAGIAQPKTVISKPCNIDADDLIKELKLPIISKVTNGSQGRGITKHDSKVSLQRFLKANKEDEFIFQEYIDNDYDLRVFFFKNKLLYTIKRQRKASKVEFRNNVSLGADQSFVELDPSTRMMAEKINCCINLDFAGIDLVKCKTNDQWYVFEINSAPQFINKSHLVIPEIVNYINSYG